MQLFCVRAPIQNEIYLMWQMLCPRKCCLSCRTEFIGPGLLLFSQNLLQIGEYPKACITSLHSLPSGH